MSHRRLVNRSQVSGSSSAAAARRQREEEPEVLELPPYEPPSCILSVKARQELNRLRDDDEEMRKYQQQLDYSKKILPKAVAHINDKAQKRKELNEKVVAKRRKEGKDENSRTEEEISAENFAKQLIKQSKDLTEKCEKALREVIDHDDERSMYTHIMDGVTQGIDAVPAPLLDDLGDEPMEEIPSAVELLEKSREDYLQTYQSRSMLQRYADNNSAYNDFKVMLHDAIYGDSIPLPKATTWFVNDQPTIFYGSGRKSSDKNGDDQEEDDEDEDIVIEGSKTDYKCPLTLQVFKEPYTSKICRHTFEKQAIMDMIKASDKFIWQMKFVECPYVGCGKNVTLKDLCDDELMRRKIKRFLQQAARDEEDDEEGEEEQWPRETSSQNRAGRIKGEIKREKSKGRGEAEL
ncbi:zinc-finger of the MIZ type in Nse subunit-domain-containing protein [Bisporella sp. PMI_857]|nr:zinc-finger of the MIZ type in Nse subunit-domain-containing protein [Bisporella sp. PMI_857]